MLALRWLYILSARAANRVICVSEHARNRLLALSGAAPERIVVIRHGSDREPHTVVLGGFVGIDLVWHDRRGPVAIEINPRVTCAYVGLSRSLGRNLAGEVIAAFEAERVCGEVHAHV